ncbi:MAG: hypothetical protein EOM77_03660 [Bacteroidia bacterium]|nr:hypothetical protein [Bacteroidia bacterium]
MITLRRFVLPCYDDAVQLSAAVSDAELAKNEGFEDEAYVRWQPAIGPGGYIKKTFGKYYTTKDINNEAAYGEKSEEFQKEFNTQLGSTDVPTKMKDYQSDLLCTAVTYFNEKNKLSDILKMKWNLAWKSNKAPEQTVEDPDKGYNTSPWFQGMGGKLKWGGPIFQGFVHSLAGNSSNTVLSARSRSNISGDWFSSKYGDQMIGPVNVINEV